MAVNPHESSEFEFLTLSPRAQKYVDTARDVEELRRMAEANPLDADQYAPGINRGEVIMSITEPDAAEEFCAVIEVQEPQDRAARRKIIESVRSDPDFGTVITEQDIQRQLDALPPFPDYRPEVREFVSGYFDRIGQWLLAKGEATPAEASKGGAAPAAGLPDEKPKDPEVQIEKPELVITIYNDQVIQLGEDGEMLSLLRSMDIPKTTAEELYIADARLAALKLIAGHEPDESSKGLTSEDVWRSYAWDGKLNSSQHLIVSDFLEGLEVDGVRVLDIYKPTESAKRRYYRNGGFAVRFVEADADSGLEQDDIFRLPNGEMLFGKRARVANMLMRASKDRPVSLQDLVDSDVYTDEEKQELGDKLSLSSMVSFLRQRLALEELLVSEDGPNVGYSIQSTKQPDKSLAYWMEYHDIDTHAATAAEAPEQRERSISDCRMIADWLVENAEILKRLKYAPFDETAHAAIVGADVLGAQEMAFPNQELRLLFDAVNIIASSDAAVDELMEKMQDNDPRWPIIDYLLAVDSPGGEMTLTRLMKDFPELDFSVDEKLALVHDGLREWPRLRDREKEDIAELSYDLFDRIGDGLQKRNNVTTASPSTIIPEIRKRLAENGLMPLSVRAESAFNQAYGQWIRRTNVDSTTREKRRVWGRQVRAAMNAALRQK